MSMTCPLCHQPIEAISNPRDLGPHIELKGRRRAILDLLARLYPEWVETERIIGYLWNDDPDGGPTNANNTLRHHMHRLRADLAPYDLTIEGRPGHGGYRLARGARPVRSSATASYHAAAKRRSYLKHKEAHHDSP
jgi:hypothetical protein